MRKSLLFDALKLLALFTVLWVIFTYVPIFHSSDKSMFTVSVDTEEKIGNAMARSVLAQDNLLRDTAVNSAIAVITNRLVASIGLTDFNYHFRVLDNPQVNAFTLPGGNIFIYSGIIKLCHSPEELAAVIAHEIGHTEKRHVINRLVKEFGLAIMFSVLTGNNSSVLNKISHSATSAIFDRKQESEADSYAFQLLDKAGINPVAFAQLFQRIDSEQGTNSLDFEILRTHPDNNSRIKAAIEYKTSKTFHERPIDVDWNKVEEDLNTEDSSSQRQ